MLASVNYPLTRSNVSFPAFDLQKLPVRKRSHEPPQIMVRVTLDNPSGMVTIRQCTKSAAFAAVIFEQT